jgi:hypothetical protein
LKAALKLLVSIAAITLMTIGITSAKEGTLRPYILASNSAGDLQQVVAATKDKLTSAGFSLAGEYSPYAGTHILIATNPTLIKLAAGSEFGGYGAAIRVAATMIDGAVQLSYVNPLYMAQIYRLNGDLANVHQQLKSALGNMQEFGSKDGLKASDLRDYHYMAFMPYFDDHDQLAEHANYQAALAAVEEGLKKGAGRVVRVYRIDLGSKEESLFGVGITDKSEDGSDQTVMNTCDKGPLKHSAHLPYDLLVSGGKIYALHGKFRIAQSFPDLTMGTFMKIVGAPGSIENVLEGVAKGK